MQIRTLAISSAFAGVFSLLAAGAEAQTAPQGTRIAQASPADEQSAQPPVRRPPKRLRIYPRYFPGPNAVRVCSATYAQEYRPSGTVIVPHTTCYWSRG